MVDGALSLATWGHPGRKLQACTFRQVDRRCLLIVAYGLLIFDTFPCGLKLMRVMRAVSAGSVDCLRLVPTGSRGSVVFGFGEPVCKLSSSVKDGQGDFFQAVLNMFLDVSVFVILYMIGVCTYAKSRV